MIKEHTIITSDDDLSIVSYLTVGFDTSYRFVICLEKVDYREYDPGSKSKRKIINAVVDKDDAYELSKRLKVSLTELPEFFANELDTDYTLATTRQTSVVFKEALNYLLDHGTHYTLEESTRYK